MATLTPEQKDKIRELETDAERAEREAAEARAELEKRPRGRPPGSGIKPKYTDEMIQAGCETLVRLSWYLCYPFALLFSGTLDELTDSEITEGAKEARNFVSRFSVLVVLLSIIGFPTWLIRTAIHKFHRNDRPQLQAVPPPADEKRG